MTVLESLAEEHRKATTAAQTSGFRRNVATWNQVDFNNVVDSWQQQLPRVTRVAEDVQEFSVIDAAAFMTVASAVQGRDIDDQINVDSYVGSMPYTGADLDAAFAGPAYRTLEAVRQDKPPNVAMYAGVAELARLTHAVTFDTAEEASLTVALSQHLTYQRIPQVGCCVRCSMLTGQYFTSKVFKRHPHCRCVHIPVLDPADAPKRSNDPYELFNALSEEEQNKIWTKAGAQAIRDGADIYQVGNSLTRPLPHRRSRRFTSEGAGKHGWYRNHAPAGKAGKRRLTVHEIYRRAGGDTHGQTSHAGIRVPARATRPQRAKRRPAHDKRRQEMAQTESTQRVESRTRRVGQVSATTKSMGRIPRPAQTRRRPPSHPGRSPHTRTPTRLQTTRTRIRSNSAR